MATSETAEQMLTRKRLSPALAFILVWLVVPNLPFVLFWILGGPPRMDAIALYFGLGILATKLSLRFIFPLYLLLVLLDVLKALSLIFSMSVTALLQSVDELSDMVLEPYFGIGLALILGVSLFFYLASKLAPYWRKTSLLPVIVPLALLIVVDSYAQGALNHSFGRFYAANAPFESAYQKSGLDKPKTGVRSPNLLLVVVESWGVLSSQELVTEVRSPLTTQSLVARYRYSEGTTAFHGTTTHGELRELCGRWASYSDYELMPSSDCLPAQYAAAGFTTVALHGFSSSYFDRHRWYPNLGFQESLFFRNLNNSGRQRCHEVFRGLCDWEVARDVKRLLQRGPGEAKFIYWLTLDSHLPVPVRDTQFTTSCVESNYPGEVCQAAASWHEVFMLIAGIAESSKLAPTDILLVGDHAPPFWKRKSRSLFDSESVPWILLKHR